MKDQYGQAVRDSLGLYEKEPLPFYGDVSLHNATRYTVGMFRTSKDRLFVGVEHHGAYTFDDFVHWSYVQDKLGITAPTDATAVADFINAQLNLPYSYDQQQTPAMRRFWEPA